MVFRNKTSPL